jgi:hypothetical protein
MTSCPKCALPVEEGTTCPACGHALSAEAAPAVAETPSPDATVSTAPRSKKSYAGAVALVVLSVCTGSLILLANARRASTVPEAAGTPAASARPAPSAVDASAAAVTVEPQHSKAAVEPQRRTVAPEWTSRVLRSNRGSVTGVVFELVANEEVGVWRRRVKPMLTVRCESGAPEVFVLTYSPASFENKPRQHTVQVSFDSSPAADQTWEHSVGHDALFALDSRESLGQIAAAETMSFTFTPFNAAPATVQFNVSGLRAQMDSAKRCSGRSRS